MRYRTLNKNWQFNRVYGRGKSYVHPHCVLYVAKNRVGYTRIGLTATKKVGHAVQRNRARRVMRAALAEHLSQNIGGYDIILVARGQTPRLKSTQLSKTLIRLPPPCRLPNDHTLSHQTFARLQTVYQPTPRASLPLCAHLQRVRHAGAGHPRPGQRSAFDHLAAFALPAICEIRL